MNKVISTEKYPIKLWLDDIEEGALEQAKNLANLPFTFKHVAIMPDSHQGYGMPIGGVLATKDVVIPNAVGVDIGCGMIAVKTNLIDISIDDLKNVMNKIRQCIPVGFNKHKIHQNRNLMPKFNDVYNINIIIKNENYDNALLSLGTLGGGNHFIEIQKGSDNHIWIMIHSGSRNLGKQVADYYNKEAVKLNEQYYSNVPKKHELAFLPIDSEMGHSYLNEMNFCVEFALANRKLMMDRILECFNDVAYCEIQENINIAHNYAKLENHFGNNVMVHRKGATSAKIGELGIIPGSQGTLSYIVVGKGNKESFESCSHGAGRKMGRKQAEKTLDLNNEIENLDKRGILHAIRGVHDLDEAPGAYKDINIVMANQTDLVDIVIELNPLAVIKG